MLEKLRETKCCFVDVWLTFSPQKCYNTNLVSNYVIWSLISLLAWTFIFARVELFVCVFHFPRSRVLDLASLSILIPSVICSVMPLAICLYVNLWIWTTDTAQWQSAYPAFGLLPPQYNKTPDRHDWGDKGLIWVPSLRFSSPLRWGRHDGNIPSTPRKERASHTAVTDKKQKLGHLKSFPSCLLMPARQKNGWGYFSDLQNWQLSVPWSLWVLIIFPLFKGKQKHQNKTNNIGASFLWFHLH